MVYRLFLKQGLHLGPGDPRSSGSSWPAGLINPPVSPTIWKTSSSPHTVLFQWTLQIKQTQVPILTRQALYELSRLPNSKRNLNSSARREVSPKNCVHMCVCVFMCLFMDRGQDTLIHYWKLETYRL